MRDYIIATDSCCDFDENLIRELDLTVIPLSVHLGQDHFRNYPERCRKATSFIPA